MNSPVRVLSILSAVCLAAAPSLGAQVYSPKVLKLGQPDTTDLKSLAAGIYRNAHAVTDREKAEAIWRFYLTDGRFVKPGMFYHIPGWSYEEPMGEVLDPIKLLNSYGFGLCYQDGPLLQATWDAGGFQHTRVWFLTGHTVAEVFYDGAYHYYDSDMMGYTTVGDGDPRSSPIASVQQLEANPKILLSKLQTPRLVRSGVVSNPWYPADVREGAIGDLAGLFTSSDDNYVYAATRYPSGHTMDFVLRPGERIVRNYRVSDTHERYLPYKTDGVAWTEFPKDVGQILTVDNGPRSEKDDRRWSTGFLEYRPAVAARQQAETAGRKHAQAVYSVQSPYVIIAAQFSMSADLKPSENLLVETSTDAGHTWQLAATHPGPYTGSWQAAPATLSRSTHGSLSSVTGLYGYLVRFTIDGRPDASLSKAISDLVLHTDFELNPRTLPQLAPGDNELTYQASGELRSELPVHAGNSRLFATRFQDADFTSERAQGYLENQHGKTAELVFPLSAPKGRTLSRVDVGGRFLDLRNGLAPDKLTAEVRRVPPWPADPNAVSSASIAWSTSPAGPWTPLWTYHQEISWPDDHATPRVLRWPEVDRSVRVLPSGISTVFVRYQFSNLALDDIRLATVQQAPESTAVRITHSWSDNGVAHEQTETFTGTQTRDYHVVVPAGTDFHNERFEIAAQ